MYTIPVYKLKLKYFLQTPCLWLKSSLILRQCCNNLDPAIVAILAEANLEVFDTDAPFIFSLHFSGW